MTTSPEEKRPYSTAYGFGSTATESIASSGSENGVRPVDGSTSVPGPSCTPAWLGRPPLMLTPPGTSMILASKRSAAWKPPPGAYCSSSLPPMASLSASVPSLDTTDVDPTTSTVCEIVAIGRSSDTSVVTPSATMAGAVVVSKPASDAAMRYLPSGSATNRK